MEGSNPKVSFIPKGSLVREESFLERRRPQSALGLLAGIIFVLVVSSFVGLYFYNNRLNSIIADKTFEIDKTKHEFSNVPEVAEARVFRARADLANELLKSHRVVSPVFVFLSDNTTESILYDKFSLKSDSSGTILELGGEALNYASLAFQADVFREKKVELLEFTIENIALTKYGSIAFNITMVFNPDFLLYTKNVSSRSIEKTEDVEPAVEPAPATTLPVSEIETAPVPTQDLAFPSDLESEVVTDSLSSDWTDVSQEIDTASTTTEEESMLRKLWSRFKFW